MTRQIHHPSDIISSDKVSLIRQQSAAAEKAGKLTPPLLELVYKEQWFKILAPKSYGGPELNLPDLVQLEEALSWADGSLGWVVTLCSGAGWFGGFINPTAATEIFNSEHLCIAGSGAATGTAEIVHDGYLINGTWKYASGVHHATHITVNCIITKNSEPQLTPSGQPVILPFILDRKDVNLIPGWKYIGMIATGSDAYSIDNIVVPANRCFKIEPGSAAIQSLLYKYPFLQLAEATLAANLSGMAVHFVDLCGPLFKEKALKFTEHIEVKTKVMFDAFDKNQMLLNNARVRFYKALSASWTEPLNDHLLQEVSTTSRNLANISRKAVDELYPYCGLLAAATDTELNQVWRDIHTASQHSLLTFQQM